MWFDVALYKMCHDGRDSACGWYRGDLRKKPLTNIACVAGECHSCLEVQKCACVCVCFTAASVYVYVHVLLFPQTLTEEGVVHGTPHTPYARTYHHSILTHGGKSYLNKLK